MSSDEKTTASTNGLTIACPTPARAPAKGMTVLTTIQDAASVHSISPTASTHDEKHAHPFSPFYNPSPTRYSLEAQKSESKQNIHIITSPTGYDTDLEAGGLTPQKTRSSEPFRKQSASTECTVWPGQKAMRLKKKAMRKANGKHMLCGWLAAQNKRTRIIIRTLMALLIIGIAIAIGLGVSKAVGGGWQNNGNSNNPLRGS